jgi:hypothetical protein
VGMYFSVAWNHGVPVLQIYLTVDHVRKHISRNTDEQVFRDLQKD